MSLKHALLGFLNYKGMTGYELKQCFDRSVHYFWNANLSQIYPTLGQMEKEGLLTMEVEYQESRPNRKVYHITGAGCEELHRWLREPMDPPPVRQAFLVKVFFGGSLEKEEILAQLRQELELHCNLLAILEDRAREGLQQSIEDTGFKREGLFWGLTLEAGIKSKKAWIEWLEEAIAKVELYS
ncbi:transcriptional regulator [Desulfocucumis palustris]|uniref:Transcriptional regulator n=1 Tax=Desulfocucumis palustris TaxID=1898651 RepID=A0A2L2XGH0_9FIRM|nr:PadR family transcriptional regulator [Desulfocucumis palustris]GBF35094.1 transcriptional regulator [Desulfocucumis palustris]